jgi:predicted enzyme related to lactoylglutathione lyase
MREILLTVTSKGQVTIPAEWYTSNFGIEFEGNDEDNLYFMKFSDLGGDDSTPWATTVFAIMPAETKLGSDRKETMINYRVRNLNVLADELRSQGTHVGPILREDDGCNGGLFTRLRDPEGNRIELYQPLSGVNGRCSGHRSMTTTRSSRRCVVVRSCPGGIPEGSHINRKIFLISAKRLTYCCQPLGVS